MKNPHPYNCNVCSEPKRPSNNWLLGVVQPVEVQIDENGLRFGAICLAVLVVRWDDRLAQGDEIAHLCGVECSIKWTTKEIDKLHAQARAS